MSAGTDNPPPIAINAAAQRVSAGIPLRAHLIWLGDQFPWVNLLAVRSAALRGGFDEVVLHHECDLSKTPYYRELCETPRVRLRTLDVAELTNRCGEYAHDLMTMFHRIGHPSRKKDVLRWALMYGEGGVYLDMDTVTLRSFEPICRNANAFCGEEHVVYPAGVRNSRSPAVMLAALARSQFRDVLRRLPRGYALFRRFESMYWRAANNAIIASAPRGTFITATIQQLLRIPPEQQPLSCVIGPHLIQHMAAIYREPDFQVHPPSAFYPLGPEISMHWFRLYREVNLDDVIGPDTYLVHWYGSVGNNSLVNSIDPDYVRRRAATQLFSALALPFAET